MDKELTEDLPQTDQVFDAPDLVVDAHSWQQQGYHIIDTCNPKRHDCHTGGISIPHGKMLTISKGRYDLVDETRSN